MIKKWFKNIGPGPLIAAAFIGPGTVTVCTLSGVHYGFTLLWVMVLAIVATIILQEMSARLGIVSQRGLSEIIRTELEHPVLKVFAIVLIISAIVIGNAAYEAGNISGAVLGLEAIFGKATISIGDWVLNGFSIFIGGIAFVLLYIGNYKVLEKVLIVLVLLMSASFLITAIITQPDLGSILKGVLIPKTPEGSIFTIIALLGTTVVPYNLFLHASLVKEKWQKASDLKHAKRDTILAVVLGGLVSMCIVIVAAAINTTEISSVSDLAKGLEPLFGVYATYFLAIGLFAAGITSAITAPLAAAYVACGCLGWSANLKSKRFRLVWILILLLGVLSASSGLKSIEIIKFAQVANGVLLPVVAGFLIWIVNKNSILGAYKNSRFQNTIGVLILIITLFLGLKSILKVFEFI